ncbi:MAG: hypothetical protein JJU05_06645 [Verrucomicrobia bacterium]|nr:hypothetical protein [Verrucomicrobiota bacterium]MCH8527074.1 hypothetical protein [Kiritimatiellia bacterium]
MEQYITQTGARPDRLRNTEQIQTAINRVHGSGGGRVKVPAGTFYTGTVWLRSGVTLELEKGAVLKAGADLEDFPESFPEDLISRRPFSRRLIGALDAEEVGLTGEGEIDGSHGLRDHLPMGESQPLGLQFIRCRKVKVAGLTLRDSGSWMQQYLQSEQIDIRGLKVWNHGNGTNDGLDLDGCRHVTVRDCRIDSHDDALVFKSTGPVKCGHILVENCELRSNCHAVKFGTESVGGFEHITVRNCRIRRSAHELYLDLVAGPRPPITGCALECTDGGEMRHIVIEDLTVEDCLTPVFIKLGNRHHRQIPNEHFTGGGTVSDIRIERMRVEISGPITSSITGYPGHPVRNVILRDIFFRTRGGTPPEQIMTQVPENSDGYPEVNMFQKVPGPSRGKQLPAWGLYLRHAEQVTLENVKGELTGEDVRPFLLEA